MREGNVTDTCSPHTFISRKVALLRVCAPQVNENASQQRLSFLQRFRMLSHCVGEVKTQPNYMGHSKELNIIQRLVSFFARSPQPAASAMIMFTPPPQMLTRIS
jgi:hypothetical protein